MFKFASTDRDSGTCWDDDVEQVEVRYNDGGLQQQLRAHLQSTRKPEDQVRSGNQPDYQHVRHTWIRPASPPSQPQADEVHALIGDLQHLTQAAFHDPSVHDTIKNPSAEVERLSRHENTEQLNVSRYALQEAAVPGSVAAVLSTNRDMLANLLQEQQQPRQQAQPAEQQHSISHAPATLPNPWSQRPAVQQPQMLSHQPQNHMHEQHAAGMISLLASQPQKPAVNKPQQKPAQQRRKSVLYSTPQQQAPKKKAKFSIKDTPASTRLPASTRGYGAALIACRSALAVQDGTNDPMQDSQAAGGAGTSAIAALLGGGSTVTPAKQTPTRTAAGLGRMGESSGAAVSTAAKTPGSTNRKGVGGSSSLFMTPRFSTNKGSRLAQGVQITPVPAFGSTASAEAPGSSAKAIATDTDTRQPAAADDEYEGPAVPAALFQDEHAAADGQQAEAGPAADGSPLMQRTATGNGRRSSVTSNPLQLMEEQRQRQAQFLSALPATAASVSRSSVFHSSRSMAGCLAQSGGKGVAVPAGSSLAKVMQQIVTAQKEQQDLLEQQADQSADKSSTAVGLLELEVVSKHWEAHLVKCVCTVTWYSQQQQTQLTQQQAQSAQQRQWRIGECICLMTASKTALKVELSPGHRVRVHYPWYEVVQQGTEQLPVLLAYLISAAR